MTPFLALLIGVPLGAALVLLAQWSQMSTRRLARLRDIESGLDRILGEDPEAPDDETPDSSEETALPVDPDNPPFSRIYYHRQGRGPRFCHCHGRQLVDGQTVLWWPNPDVDGAFWLVCVPEVMVADAQ